MADLTLSAHQSTLNKPTRPSSPNGIAHSQGFTAVKHHREVGAGYFDEVSKLVTRSSTLSALEGSTEEEQF